MQLSQGRVEKKPTFVSLWKKGVRVQSGLAQSNRAETSGSCCAIRFSRLLLRDALTTATQTQEAGEARRAVDGAPPTPDASGVAQGAPVKANRVRRRVGWRFGDG